MPRPPDLARIRDGFTRELSRLTMGIVQGRPDGFWLGPLPLIRLGPPETVGAGVRWPVTGGLLARRPGGWVGVEWREGLLRGYLEGYQPSLPAPLYTVTQDFAHHELTRLYLLAIRGRDPEPGPPVPARRRLAALGIDLALCWLVARRRPTRFAGAVAGYHLAAWSVGGLTVGGALLKQRVVAIDGTRPSFGQALARLLQLPFHGTTVVDERTELEIATQSQ